MGYGHLVNPHRKQLYHCRSLTNINTTKYKYNYMTNVNMIKCERMLVCKKMKKYFTLVTLPGVVFHKMSSCNNGPEMNIAQPTLATCSWPNVILLQS